MTVRFQKKGSSNVSTSYQYSRVTHKSEDPAYRSLSPPKNFNFNGRMAPVLSVGQARAQTDKRQDIDARVLQDGFALRIDLAHIRDILVAHHAEKLLLKLEQTPQRTAHLQPVVAARGQRIARALLDPQKNRVAPFGCQLGEMLQKIVILVAHRLLEA